MLKQRPDGGGYLCVWLWLGNKQHVKKVASLVAAAFVGPRPAGLDVLHGDGNRINNAASNLRYGTVAENMADARLHGTMALGERNGMAKIDAATVRAIRAAEGTLYEIGRQFGVSYQHAGSIRQRLVWRHVSG
jgi:hypothetical protein